DHAVERHLRELAAGSADRRAVERKALSAGDVVDDFGSGRFKLSSPRKVAGMDVVPTEPSECPCSQRWPPPAARTSRTAIVAASSRTSAAARCSTRCPSLQVPE